MSNSLWSSVNIGAVLWEVLLVWWCVATHLMHVVAVFYLWLLVKMGSSSGDSSCLAEHCLVYVVAMTTCGHWWRWAVSSLGDSAFLAECLVHIVAMATCGFWSSGEAGRADGSGGDGETQDGGADPTQAATDLTGRWETGHTWRDKYNKNNGL